MEFLISELRATGVLDAKADLNPATVLGEPPAFVGYRHPLHAKAHARMTDNDIVVTGQADTILSLTCARCLDVFEKPIDVHFEQVFEPGVEKIDMKPEIRESILIDLPLTALCSENCKGICADCGGNLNRATCKCAEGKSDPRWAGLNQLKLK
jgi:uncharacterized protein